MGNGPALGTLIPITFLDITEDPKEGQEREKVKHDFTSMTFI